MSYQANIPDVQAWLSHFNDLVGKTLPTVAKYGSFANELYNRFVVEVALPNLIQRMLEPDPSLRPSALDVAELTSPLCCYRCNTEREKLEAVAFGRDTPSGEVAIALLGLFSS